MGKKLTILTKKKKNIKFMSEFYIGFMSGTSFDGIDASLVRTDGNNDFEAITDVHISYPPEFRASLLEPFVGMVSFLGLEKQLTNFHVDATNKLLHQANLTPGDIKALGFHGQTIFHNPDSSLTWQIGNPHLLAQKTSIDVIHDFRRRDIALGGHGAPLVPIFHKFLMQKQEKPVVVVNIGGVANLTYISEEDLIAFDTGPGNALIDDAMMKYFGRTYDDSGKIASQGLVDDSIVNKILTGEYFNLKYPKSLDRNTFNFLEDFLADHAPADIVATLTYISSAAIAHSVVMLPNIPKKVFICGGGVKNTQMLLWIKKILTSKRVLCSIENISNIDGFDPDYIESQAFAYLSARFFRELPSAFPSTTGARKQNICGCLVKSYS